MATIAIPPGATFKVLNVATVQYDGVNYRVDGPLVYSDGSSKSLNDLLLANGSPAYALTELKRCFKVEGYDPDTNASWFTLYSSNSKSTGNNESAKVPGGMWCEILDFKGDPRADGGYDNPVLELWRAFGKGPADWASTWIGFRLAYGTAATRAYVMTYQDDFLQESIPTPSVTIDVTYMHDVKLHGVFKPTPPEPYGHHYVPIRSIRLWRTLVTASEGAIFRRVPVDAISDGYNSEGEVREFNHDPGKFTRQIPDPTKSYGYALIDTVADNELLEEDLKSVDWDPPPFREALQLVNLWNGMMAVHVGNTVMFCEPYRPHAWPVKYRYPLPYEIVSKAVDGQTLIVTTTGPAYIFTGAHPAQMNSDPLQNTQAGKRADLFCGGVRTPGRAICVTPIGVCYATDDGIVASNQGRSILLTEKLFTKDEWKSRYGSKFGRMRLAYSNGKLLCWFWRSADVGFIVDIAGTSLTEWLPYPLIGCATQMPGSEGLYLMGTTFPVDASTTAKLQRFEDPSSNRMTADWMSRKAILAYPLNFSCFQIAGVGQVLVKVFALDTVVYEKTLTLVAGVPVVDVLPDGFREREWTIRFLLNPGAVVREFYIAQSEEELRSA